MAGSDGERFARRACFSLVWFLFAATAGAAGSSRYRAAECPVSFVVPEGFAVSERAGTSSTICTLELGPSAAAGWVLLLGLRASALDTALAEEGFRRVPATEEGQRGWQIGGPEASPATRLEGRWPGIMATRTTIGRDGSAHHTCHVVFEVPGGRIGRLVTLQRCDESVASIVAFLDGLEIDPDPQFDEWGLVISDIVVQRYFQEASQDPDRLLPFDALGREVQNGDEERSRAALEVLLVLAESPRTRWHASSALARIGPRAAPAIPRLLEIARSVGANTHERFSVLQALCSIGPAAGSSAGQIASLGGDSLCLARIEAPVELALEVLLAELTSETVTTREQAARAAGGYPDAQVVAALTDMLQPPGPSFRAIEALGLLGPAAVSATPRLREVLALYPAYQRPSYRGLVVPRPQAGDSRRRIVATLWLIDRREELPEDVGDAVLEAAALVAEHWLLLQPAGGELLEVSLSRAEDDSLRISPTGKLASAFLARGRYSDEVYRVLRALADELARHGIRVVPEEPRPLPW